jgi:hypothetical protein
MVMNLKDITVTWKIDQETVYRVRDAVVWIMEKRIEMKKKAFMETIEIERAMMEKVFNDSN